ncbi:MAG: hypothetical protein C0434_15465 [Xanthomonadaceae bacterium]|nr:hypothetical protein [Xanthomonadaceae bacterium]
MSRRAAGLASAAALLMLAGCAADPAGSAATDADRQSAAEAALAVPIAGAVPEAQLAAVIAGFDAALKAKLAALPLSPAYRLVSGGGQPSRLILDAERAFEVGNAQLKPEMLLPLADAVEASRVGGAWVVHVIGVAATRDDGDLAERRAASVRAYLAGKGLSGGRLRAESRSGSGRSLELQFVPIVEGREARAWMAPAAISSAR